MNYAIKTLLDKSQLCNDLLQKKREEFLRKDFEMTSDYQFCLTDIKNLEKMIEELIKAIEILNQYIKNNG